MKLPLLLALFLALTSCASVHVDDEVCKSDTFSYTDLQFVSGKGVALAQYYKDIDLSSSLQKISEYGELSVFLGKSNIESLGSDLTWVGSMRIDMVSDKDTILLANTSFNGQERNVDIHINGSVNLAKYLRRGKIRLIYTLSGEAPPSFRVNDNICFLVSADTSKSLSDYHSK
jgi:hypothetical protein